MASSRSSAVVLALALCGAFQAQQAVAQQSSDKQLGAVDFATSCNETAQRRFNRGIRYQHSFWYSQAREIFEDVLKADATCGIATWGMALSLLANPHNAPPPANLPLGLTALQKGKSIGAGTQREKDYIDSLLVLYTDYDKLDRNTRVQAYLKATEALALRYPNDDEAQINYAITLNVAASPADKSYSNQLKGVAILEPIWKRQPQHPGVAHYLIHLYDYPAIATKGLDAANRYAKIAPDAPHAQHMPSHIFTRVGYWKESISSNTASASSAKASKEYSDQLHAMDYMVYAHLQLGQDAQAQSLIAAMPAIAASFDTERGGAGSPFALAASPARYAVERGDWPAAAALAVRPSRALHTEAITNFARALGAARSGKPEAARPEIARLAELSGKLREAKDAYWAGIVDIQRQVASGWLLFAEGKADEALAAMRAAADAEDRTDKSPVTPGPLAPARELLGEMLAARGMAKEALAAFEATLAKEPNRFRAQAGAAAAAASLGDKARARVHFEKLVALAGESSRPELAAARRFLASN